MKIIIHPKIINGEVVNEVDMLKRQIRGRDIWTQVVEEENLKYRDLYNTVIDFMKEHDITSEDSVNCAKVDDYASDFIVALFKIVKRDLNLVEED